jgi:hypothetical protein
MRLLCLDVLSGSSQAESAAQKISDWASTNTSRPARLRTLLNETSVALGQRVGTLAWLTGEFTRSGKTQIAQPFNNNRRLGLIIYQADGSGADADRVRQSRHGPGSGVVSPARPA